MISPCRDAGPPVRRWGGCCGDSVGGGASAAGCRTATVRPWLLIRRGLLDQLGHAQADVLGLSWGGALAQQFALRCPSRVRRLVLAATSPGALMVPGHPRALARMLTPRRHRGRGYAPGIAGELYGGS